MGSWSTNTGPNKYGPNNFLVKWVFGQPVQHQILSWSTHTWPTDNVPNTFLVNDVLGQILIIAKTIFGYSFFLPHAHHVNENCSETSWHTKDLNIVNKWRSWRWDMWKYCRGIKKFSSTCGSSLQGDHMINNSQWLLKSWRQSQLEDAGEADMEKQIFHLCNSNTFWEMKKTFLLKVHVFFLAKRNSWRNIIARVVTGDKLWLEKNCKVYLDSDLPHLLAGRAPDLGCCLASLPKTIFA